MSAALSEKPHYLPKTDLGVPQLYFLNDVLEHVERIVLERTLVLPILFPSLRIVGVVVGVRRPSASEETRSFIPGTGFQRKDILTYTLIFVKKSISISTNHTYIINVFSFRKSSTSAVYFPLL